jgi:hypothetical protein
MIEEDLDVMHRAIGAAIGAGRLPGEAAALVDVQGLPPSLAVRDRLREAQADQILVRCGAMSAQTMAARQGLDAPAERHLIAAEAAHEVAKKGS